VVGTERLHHHNHELRSAAGRDLALRDAWPRRPRLSEPITFDEVVPPERIVYRHGGGEDVEPVQFRQTVIFEDLGGRTRMTWRGNFPSAAERDRVIREYGAAEGLVQTMARLGEYVSANLASRTTPRAAAAS
jgi:uncharacterized protein YndB with AHSA1/START domain